MKNSIENILERSMFASRWVLSPIYIVLSLTLFVIMIKVIQEFIHEMTHIFEMNINELLVFVLHIVDLALIGNLILQANCHIIKVSKLSAAPPKASTADVPVFLVK